MVRFLFICWFIFLKICLNKGVKSNCNKYYLYFTKQYLQKTIKTKLQSLNCYYCDILKKNKFIIELFKKDLNGCYVSFIMIENLGVKMGRGCALCSRFNHFYLSLLI